MPMISYHPAPGLGDLLPGFFAVPQNPFDRAVHGITQIPHVGELLAARWTIPENPLARMVVMGPAPHCLCSGPGCGIGCGPNGVSGLGGIEDIWTTIKNTASTAWATAKTAVGGIAGGGWQTYALIGGGLLVVYFLTSRGKGRSPYRQAVSEARKKYTAAVAGAKARYRRRYQKIPELA